MPVPATSGQLRTKLEDMQIGDYIACKYTASSGAAGSFSDLGGIVDTEIPVASSDTPNGYFYFIKVDKGLLLADKVVQHSVSWNTLNKGGFISGRAFKQSLIPKMTSDIAPSGIASANGDDGTYKPWQAFDKVYTGVGWAANAKTTNTWLAYEFTEARVVGSYRITPRSNYLISAPKDWRIEATNDNINWAVLDTQT